MSDPCEVKATFTCPPWVSTIEIFLRKFNPIKMIIVPVSKMKMSFTMRFLPSPSRPPKTIRYCPNWVEEWQFLVLGGCPLIYININKF